ncbi:MAG: sulfatase-like hydrolase/transferase [Chloroflexi bacterium]|nr:sulfatase-like hydrolase/transferase [Chloroflexota bacterium]
MTSDPRTPARQPNILMILTDQQRRDGLGASGNRHIRTPNMDRLAEEGVRCSGFFVSYPFCMPSRATYLTGRYPHAHGCWDNGVVLPSDTVTLADRFAEHGYHTALIGKGHLTTHQSEGSPDAYTALDRPGFGDWHGPYYGFQEVWLTAGHNRPTGHYGLWLREHHPESLGLFEQSAAVKPSTGAPSSWKSALPAEHHASTWIGDRTLAFLDENRDRPFFLQVSFPDPHMPFCPPAPYDDMYPLDEVPMPRRRLGELDDKPPHFAAFHEGRIEGFGGRASDDLRGVTDDQIREIVAHTYGMLSLIDDNLGRIFRRMDELGLFENTLVLLTTDHGELLGDHWLIGKGPFHYDALINVPLLWRFPDGRAAGRVADGLMSNVDVAPTLLDYAGLPPLPDMHGRSMLPLLRDGDEAAARDRVLVEFDWRFVPGLRAKTIRTQHHKLTVYAGEPYGELFDLDDDPDEFVNRWDDPAYAAIKQDLTRYLLDMLIESESKLPPRLAPN